MAQVVEAFVDWHPGDPPLPDGQHAANLRAIRAEIQGLYLTNGTDLVTTATQSDDLRTATFKTAAGFQFALTLPPGLAVPVGERIVGKRYQADDLFTWQGSSYIVLVGHVAATLIADDLAAKRIQLVAAKGKDAEVVRGAYVAGQPYAAGDVVYVGTPGVTEVVYYRSFADVPYDGAGPGNYPWGAVSVSPYVELDLGIEGKPAAGAVLRRYAIPRPTFLLAGLANSVATLDVAAAAASTYAVKVDGATVATFTFAANSKVATWTLAATAFSFKGQTLTVVAPATQDANAAGLAVTLTLNR